MEDIEDLSKMKVADLKKHLKSKGLPVTGNKTELVERLQQVLHSEEHPSLESSGAAEDDEFDEEEILGGEDIDIGKITQEEEAAALAGSIRVKDDSLLTEKKKISLKRSEPCLSSPSETVTPTEETTTGDSVESTNSNANKENSLTSPEEPKHKVIKLTGITSENNLEARTKKFGVTTPDTEESRKQARAARFGTSISTTNGTNKRAPKLSTETGGTDMEKLKKRAERFGEITSKSLSKLEKLEKLKLRQDRFGSSDSDTEKKTKEPEVTSEDAAAKRAKRFGSTETEPKVAVTAPSADEEEDTKQKRAQRFAV